MIKKSVSALLCGIMMFSAVGCSSKTTTNENNSGVVQENQQNQDNKDDKENKEDKDNKNDKEESSSVGAKKLVSSVVDAGYVRAALEVDEKTAIDSYHINLDDVEEYAIVETQISPGPGFMVAVQAKEGKLEAVQKAVESIKADLVGKSFYPAEQEAAEKATVKTSGNIVYLTLFNDEISGEATAFIEKTLGK